MAKKTMSDLWRVKGPKVWLQLRSTPNTPRPEPAAETAVLLWSMPEDVFPVPLDQAKTAHRDVHQGDSTDVR
jgi:hypothetical protein